MRDELHRVSELLINQVAHWTPARWADRGKAVYELVQRLADRAADANGQARHVVPRLPDVVLPDQLRVMVADLIESPADVSSSIEEIDQLRRSITIAIP